MSGPDRLSDGDSSSDTAVDRLPKRSLTRRPGTVVLAVLLALVGILGVLHITHYPTFSPYDEIQHFDTLEKNSRFILIGRGELLSQTTMREAACHGSDFDWDLGACDAVGYDPASFPWEGWNTAYSASPVYYGITGLAGRFVDFVVPAVDSLLTASRLAGLSWVLLAIIFMWLLLGEFSIPHSVRFFILVLLASSPTVLHLSSIVNPDITGLAGGAAIVWLTVRWERGASPAWLLALVTVLTVLGKPLNAAVIGAMIGYLAIRYLQGRNTPDNDRSRNPKGAVLALAGGLLLGVVPWLVAQAALSDASALDVPQIRQFAGGSLTLADVTSQFTALVSPLRNPYLAAFIAGPLTVLLVAASDIFLLGGNIGVAMLSRDRRASALATTALITAVLLGPAVVLFMYISHDGFIFPVTPRYGMPLLPLFAVGLAVAATQKKPVRVVLALLAVSSLAIVTVEMLGII